MGVAMGDGVLVSVVFYCFSGVCIGLVTSVVISKCNFTSLTVRYSF